MGLWQLVTILDGSWRTNQQNYGAPPGGDSFFNVLEMLSHHFIGIEWEDADVVDETKL